METLSKWLENKGPVAEEKALDYLNKKGLFSKNKNLGIKEQIIEIEKANARDLYFKDCERKLKNNIRQIASNGKNTNIRAYTFKISNDSRDLLEKMKNHYGFTVGQMLEKLIYDEDKRLSSFTNHPMTHAPQRLQLQHSNPEHFGNCSNALMQQHYPQTRFPHQGNLGQTLKDLMISDEQSKKQ
ncbi:hypothetical protein AAG587_19610 [Vreelandella neptunia]|uniref:hypothetical protein n=1 Tax=Vreelandella neptunia TaxID=115551 RepID=UPI003159D0F6